MRFLFLVLLSLTGIVAITKGDDDEETGKIVGGFQTTIDRIPYQAALLLSVGICGGSIISPNWIVTAAHCTIYTTPRVRVGSTFHDNGGQMLTVKRMITHPNYNSKAQMDADIALVEVSTMRFNRNVRPVRLPNPGEYPADGAQVLASGWGFQASGGTSPRNVRAVVLKIVNRSTCKNRYTFLTGNMICASDDGKDTCQNDSGGPLVVARTRTLAGITSFGRECALPGYPGVYVNVGSPEIRQFIRRHTGL